MLWRRYESYGIAIIPRYTVWCTRDLGWPRAGPNGEMYIMPRYHFPILTRNINLAHTPFCGHPIHLVYNIFIGSCTSGWIFTRPYIRKQCKTKFYSAKTFRCRISVFDFCNRFFNFHKKQRTKRSLFAPLNWCFWKKWGPQKLVITAI